MFQKRAHGLLVRCAILIAIVLGMVSAPYVAQSQQAPRLFRVGHLAAGGRTPDGLPPAPLREALRRLGDVQGQNVAYEARFAGGRTERLAGFAAELVRLKVDVIAAQGGPAAAAAKQVTSTIPIVTAPAAGDNIASGLIASLARPGGHVTG
ncbi:MAG TPA: ABC transporter substrate binding protein [Candidatus Limnocylindria bacterium]|nr:ABC transporter substrate binding protein [Candidatus Limnocylindria bacterium]